MADMNRFSFILTAKNEIVAFLDKKYGKYKTPPKDTEIYVEHYYQFEDKSSIKIYKGNKEKQFKISFYGRDEDYQELREKDMHLNRNPVEESNTGSPSVSDLNFRHPVIGSDETGNGETFKIMVVTAAYVNAEADMKKWIKMGINDSKQIAAKINSIGKEITGIHCWEEMKDSPLLSTDSFVTRIITNEEYNKRCYENGENKHDIMKAAHLQVLREVYKRNPNSMIVVDDFYGMKEENIEEFKKELSSGDPLIEPNHIFVTVKADSKIMAVSLASVISTYICNLGYDYVQGILDRVYKKNPEEMLDLPKDNPTPDKLSEFLFKLKPERRNEFIDKYAKKNFDNVQTTLKRM